MQEGKSTMTIARKLHLLILVVIPGMLAQVMLGIFQSLSLIHI